MGQRLVVQIKNNDGEPLANAYYHWSGYTGSSAEMTNLVLGYLEDAPKEYNDKQKAAWSLFMTGARFNPTEVGLLIEKGIKKDWEFLIDDKEVDRNDGLLSVTEEGMQESEDWAEGLVEINIETMEIYFGVISIETAEDWEAWREKDSSLAVENLPVLNFCEELEFTLEEWYWFYKRVKQLIHDGHYVAASEDRKTVFQFIE